MPHAVREHGARRQRATATAVRRALRPQVRRRPVGILIAALAAGASLVGLGLLLLVVAPPRPAPLVEQGTLLSGDLSLRIQDTGWITHDTIGGATPAPDTGFQMPASMMPGMPDEGKHRLYIEVTLDDVGQASASFAPQEFTLRTPEGRSWPLDQPASFGPATLLPGQIRSLDLLFDIPDTVSQVLLAWNHDGETQQLAIDSRPPPPHNHG
jgi:hypothetical protein